MCSSSSRQGSFGGRPHTTVKEMHCLSNVISVLQMYWMVSKPRDINSHIFTNLRMNVLESHFPKATQLIPGPGSELSRKVEDVIHWHSHCPLREHVWLSSVNGRCQGIQIKCCWSLLMKRSLSNGQMIFMTRGSSAIDPFMAIIFASCSFVFTSCPLCGNFDTSFQIYLQIIFLKIIMWPGINWASVLIASFLVMTHCKHGQELFVNFGRHEKGRRWGDRKPNPVPLVSQTCLGRLVSSAERIISMCSVSIFLASGLRGHLPTVCFVGAEVAVY